RRAQHLSRDLAHERAAELIALDPPWTAATGQELAPDQRIEERPRLEDPERIEILGREWSIEDGGAFRELLLGGRQVVEARLDCGLDRQRQRPIVCRCIVEARAERADDLLDEERVPAGPLRQSARELRSDRPSGERRGELLDLRGEQRARLDPRGEHAAQQIRAALVELRPGREKKQERRVAEMS